MSTAFVQPPLPFKKTEGLIPLPGLASSDVGAGVESIYRHLLDGGGDLEEYRTSKLFHTWTTHNSYILSKTLAEHLIVSRFEGCLPLQITRPSSVHVSLDGSYGSPDTTLCRQRVLGDMPFLKYWPLENGSIDWIPVDCVAELTLGSLQKKPNREKVAIKFHTSNSRLEVGNSWSLASPNFQIYHFKDSEKQTMQDFRS